MANRYLSGPATTTSRIWESVFSLSLVNVRDNPDLNSPPEQARDFLAAMRTWDAELRKHRHFEGDLPTFVISLRQDVFGLADVEDGRRKDEASGYETDAQPGP